MSRTSSFGLMTRLGYITGLALLQDMFQSVNNRSNGFEHHLRTGRYTRSVGERHNGSTTFDKRNGAKECERRLKQLRRQGVVSVTFVGPHEKLKGKGALAKDFDGDKVSIQMNDMQHPHAFGWHRYNAAHWAVGFHGRIDHAARYAGA